jgi:hypothetical protein
MKNIFGLYCLLMFSQIGFAQQSIDKIMQLRPVLSPVYEVGAFDYFVEMPFGKSKIVETNLPDVEDLKNLKSIDLIYTQFRRSADFNQPKLNRYRLENLKKAMPEIFELDNIQWNIVEQTTGNNKEEAEQLFHGFVLNIRRENEVPEVKNEEVTYIENVLNGTPEEEFPDSIVLNVFQRNNWNKMLIVADLTGSMSPYVAQVLLWFRLNDSEERAKHFLFFNDGNKTPDAKKKVGRTGGLYASPATNFKEIEALAYQTMNNGDGGDWPENDMEALLTGMKQCPECEDIILIADNNAAIRDWRMMQLVKKPIRVILCGVEDFINPQYLNLVKTSKGSLHTIEDDLTTLINMKEGQTIVLYEKTYRVQKGKFVIIRERN